MSHIRIDWGLAGSIREVTQSPLQSFPVKLEHELEGSNTTRSVPKRLSAIWDVWESRNVSLWNPEYRKILQLQETRIPLMITIQIHVPQWSWLESGLYGVESRKQDCVKFPRRWGKISRQETYYVNTRSEKTGGLKKGFLWPFGPQFGLKMRGGGPPGPLPWTPLSDTDAACASTVLL